MQFTRRRVLIGIAVLLLLVVGFAGIAWRQEVGSRASPLPTAIPANARADVGSPVERRDSKAIEQVWVPPGWFRRGSDPGKDFWYARTDETPQHDVRILRGFWLDKFEVTNAAFKNFVDDGGYERRQFWSNEGWQWKGRRSEPDQPLEAGFEDPDQPRCWITWFEAEAYARWRGGRLPSEAEWEYAARGPRSAIYPWGDEWEASRAHTSEAGVWRTRPVGSHLGGSSWCGAHDLCGNVHEWTADWYDSLSYRSADRDDPRGPGSGRLRVIHGGSFGGPQSSARSARRMGRAATQPSLAVGFRVASDDEPSTSRRDR